MCPLRVPSFYEMIWNGMEARNENPLQNQEFCKGFGMEILVRGIGFEPTTSTMSRCCSTTELTARLEVRADYYPITPERAILFLKGTCLGKK